MSLCDARFRQERIVSAYMNNPVQVVVVLVVVLVLDVMRFILQPPAPYLPPVPNVQVCAPLAA